MKRMHKFYLSISDVACRKKTFALMGTVYLVILFLQFLPAQAQVTFTAKSDFVTSTSPYSVAIGDINIDGISDLAVANYTSSKVSVFLNTTTIGDTIPTFSTRTDYSTGYNPYSVAVGDLNSDGKPDLAVANYVSNTVSVFLNTTAPGASTPSFIAKSDFGTASGPRFITIDDLNADNKPDLIIVNFNSSSISVLLNLTSPGSFTPSFTIKTDFTAGTSPHSVTVDDLNNDGKPDLAVANIFSNTASVFINKTAPGALTPSFTAKTDFATGSGPRSVTSTDINSDGKLDLAVANYTSNTISVFLNTTTPGDTIPAFLGPSDFSTGNYPWSIASDELDEDDRPDLAVANLNSNTVSVLLNTTPPSASTPLFLPKTDFTTGNGPYSIAIGNLNGDTMPDLAVANYNSNTVSVFINKTGMVVPQYTLTVYAVNGTVAVDPPTGPYDSGTIVTLTPSASVGYHFANWTGDVPSGHETDNPLSITMNADKTITANFIINTYTISASAGANGSITPPGTTIVNHGDNQSYIIIPDAGFAVEDVLVDDESVGAVSSYDFINVTDSHSISASFIAQSSTLIYVSAMWNLVSVPRNQSNYDADIVFPGKTGNMYSYDMLTGIYGIAEVLSIGPGYWVSYPAPATITIIGSAAGSVDLIANRGGWILVGSRATPIPVSTIVLSNGATIGGSAYRYVPASGTYEPTDVINPGEACWINVSKACIITLP